MPAISAKSRLSAWGWPITPGSLLLAAKLIDGAGDPPKTGNALEWS